MVEKGDVLTEGFAVPPETTLIRRGSNPLTGSEPDLVCATRESTFAENVPAPLEGDFERYAHVVTPAWDPRETVPAGKLCCACGQFTDEDGGEVITECVDCEGPRHYYGCTQDNLPCRRAKAAEAILAQHGDGSAGGAASTTGTVPIEAILAQDRDGSAGGAATTTGTPRRLHSPPVRKLLEAKFGAPRRNTTEQLCH